MIKWYAKITTQKGSKWWQWYSHDLSPSGYSYMKYELLITLGKCNLTQWKVKPYYTKCKEHRIYYVTRDYGQTGKKLGRAQECCGIRSDRIKQAKNPPLPKKDLPS